MYGERICLSSKLGTIWKFGIGTQKMSSATHKINQLQHNDNSWDDERRHIAVTLTLLLMGMAILVACVFAIRHVLKYETINAVDADRAERYEEYIR